MARTGHLLVERLHTVAGDVEKRLHLVRVLTQAGAGQDHRLLHAGGVKPVLVHAALPAGADVGAMRLGGGRSPRDIGHPHHSGDV